jgi:hypothetical protein
MRYAVIGNSASQAGCDVPLGDQIGKRGRSISAS